MKDIVAEINDTSDIEEQRRLLTTLSQTFSRAQMNNDLGLEQAVSRRRYGLKCLECFPCQLVMLSTCCYPWV